MFRAILTSICIFLPNLLRAGAFQLEYLPWEAQTYIHRMAIAYNKMRQDEVLLDLRERHGLWQCLIANGKDESCKNRKSISWMAREQENICNELQVLSKELFEFHTYINLFYSAHDHGSDENYNIENEAIHHESVASDNAENGTIYRESAPNDNMEIENDSVYHESVASDNAENAAIYRESRANNNAENETAEDNLLKMLRFTQWLNTTGHENIGAAENYAQQLQVNITNLTLLLKELGEFYNIKVMENPTSKHDIFNFILEQPGKVLGRLLRRDREETKLKIDKLISDTYFPELMPVELVVVDAEPMVVEEEDEEEYFYGSF